MENFDEMRLTRYFLSVPQSMVRHQRVLYTPEEWDPTAAAGKIELFNYRRMP